jgi:predicted transposase YbfD/YdcC
MEQSVFSEIEKVEERFGFSDFFKNIPDHRLARKKLHLVEEILFLALCGVIANCSSWEDIELFGKKRLIFLRKYLPYKHGIPSDDTLRRFFRVLDPKAFEEKFRKWVTSFQYNLAEKVVAIDGKTLRHSFDGEISAIHLVSAFLSEDKIVLGQEKVAGKSNEITAIPELIDTLDLKGAIVTIDAMGTQHAIANKIIEKEANYVLALKGNQSSLVEDVKEIFGNYKEQMEIFEDVDSGHGRIETRECTVISDPEWMKWLKAERPEWNSIKSVIKIRSIFEIKDKVTTEERFYITSLVAPARKLSNAVRKHWGVESMHWILDVTFGDDQSRVRKGNAPQNMAVIKKSALNLLQIIKKKFPRIDGVRTSIARLRKIAAWEEQWLMDIINTSAI